MSGGIPTFETTMNSRRRKDVPPGHVVHAQPIKDSSYMESMVNFFHDIGQAYSNTAQTEEKESVLWARIFDYKSVLDPEFHSCADGKKTDVGDTLLLVLGYKNGIQGWDFRENGEIQEIFSLRQGPVKTACLIPPPPRSASDCVKDEHGIARPLLAVCMAADRKQLFTSVSILSLRTGDQVMMLKFEDDVEQIRVGLEGLLIVTLKQEIQAFNVLDFKLLFTIRDCYPSPNVDGNPIAVGREWLAYSPAKNISGCQSAGGMEDDGINSYAATVLNAAKTIKKGLVNLSETVNWLAKTSISGGEELTTNSTREAVGQRSRNQSGSSLPELTDGVPGLITVINVPKLCKKLKEDHSPSSPDEPSINGILPAEAVVAHFPAHDQPVACMEFSPCGSLLATADKRAHAFHVFSILPHPVSPKMSAVHHLYSLYRGDTSAKVQEISFSGDCRWLSVSTLRGTSHVFPIAAYGGLATVRTHVNHRVVNRSSLFHKSAGLEDMDQPPAGFGGNSTITDGQNAALQVRRRRSYSHGSRIHNSTNPRLPPHSQPTLVQPLAQIGSTRTQQVLNLPKITGQTPHSAKTDKSASSGWQADVIVASVFMNTRLQLSRSSNGHDNALRRIQLASSSKGGQCLLIFTSNGILTEYHLEPRPLSGISKVSDDSLIELVYVPRFQWPLQRLLTWGEVTLPLNRHNMLLEVDTERLIRIDERLDMTSSLTSSISTVSAKTTDPQTNFHENYKIEQKNKIEDFLGPKTQQPTSRNFRATKPTSNHYPGVAVMDGKTSRLKNQHSSDIIPTGHHSDRGVTGRHIHPVSRDFDSTDRFNGQLMSNHRQEIESTEHRPSSAESVKSTASLNLTDYDEWLAQVEMISHEGPARRLWMGPQFCFKLRQSTGSTLLLSSTSSAMFTNRGQFPTACLLPVNDGARVISTSPGSHHDVYLDDDLDLQSLKIQPNRSDPMPTPKTGGVDQYELNSITIEAGSGNFDRTAHMLEIGAYGSLDDRRFVSTDCEDRLRDKIAEAMMDSENVTIKTRDIRSKSDSSEVLEFTDGSDPLLTAGEFDFDYENHSLEIVDNT